MNVDTTVALMKIFNVNLSTRDRYKEMLNSMKKKILDLKSEYPIFTPFLDIFLILIDYIHEYILDSLIILESNDEIFHILSKKLQNDNNLSAHDTMIESEKYFFKIQYLSVLSIFYYKIIAFFNKNKIYSLGMLNFLLNMLTSSLNKNVTKAAYQHILIYRIPGSEQYRLLFGEIIYTQKKAINFWDDYEFYFYIDYKEKIFKNKEELFEYITPKKEIE